MEHDTIVALMQPGLDLPELATLLHRPAWMARAACRGQGVAAFFGGETSDPAPAKAVCAGCPVRQECFSFALDDLALVGVWGGTTVQERRVLRRESA